MHAVVLSNPRSGRGRAVALAARIADTLEARGHKAKRLAVGEHEPLDAQRLATADALVVVGGDGTVHHAADAAIAAGTPIYHAACGNENLFAREFGMRRGPEHVTRAVEGGRTTRVDLARCNAQTFLIMCSLGPDAGIIQTLDASRTRASGHMAYARPVLDEILRPTIPRLSIEVDGTSVVEGRRGMVVVANSRQYALRIDPAPRAVMDDGRFDVVFMPCATSARAALWMLAARARVHTRLPGVIQTIGERVSIGAEAASPVHQLDGELGESGPSDRLELSVEPRVLPVLLP